MKIGRPLHDLSGLKLGRLLVMRRDHSVTFTAAWVVQCECGSAPRTVTSGNLVSGKTRTCGCIRREPYSARDLVDRTPWVPPVPSADEISDLDRRRTDARRRAKLKWNGANKEQKATYNRERLLIRDFGITSEDYDAMLERQGGVCAICGTLRLQSGAKHMHVDHCHATGAVRGILCFMCNTSIGKLDDDPERLRRAASYIEYHRRLAVQKTG